MLVLCLLINVIGTDRDLQNYMFPHLGEANTPYARSVRPQTLMPADPPDAGVLFDTVMVRKKFKPHPTEISSMLFYLASVIIHGRLFLVYKSYED